MQPWTIAVVLARRSSQLDFTKHYNNNRSTVIIIFHDNNNSFNNDGAQFFSCTWTKLAFHWKKREDISYDIRYDTKIEEKYIFSKSINNKCYNKRTHHLPSLKLGYSCKTMSLSEVTFPLKFTNCTVVQCLVSIHTGVVKFVIYK